MAIINTYLATSFDSISSAIAAARPHDTMIITGNISLAEPVIINKPLNLIGANPHPIIKMDKLLPLRSGIFITHCDSYITNIEFEGGKSTSGNGAGIWHASGNLAIHDCCFRSNQNGIMVAGGESDCVTVTGCSFYGNGGSCGHTHGMYVNRVRIVRVDGCTFENSFVGHHFKSRAGETYIENSYFSDAPSSTTSLAIDIPNGGLSLVRKNFLVKSRDSMSRKFISFGSEGRLHPKSQLDIHSNIFINQGRRISIGVANYSLHVPATMSENAYERVTFQLIGRGREVRRRASQAAIAAGV